MRVGAAGVIETIVKAISTHINNVNVCEQGCDLLNNITGNGKNSGKATVKTKVK